MYAIYERPLDYPHSFVVRRWWVNDGQSEPVAEGEPLAVVETLHEAREEVPKGLIRMARDKGDPLSIVETWL